MKPGIAIAAVVSAISLQPSALAFEGRISATLTRGGEAQTLFYTVGANGVRIERGETNGPHARNLVALDSGAITLVFPHNRSFVRLKNAGQSAASPFPGAPGMPLPLGGLPPGIGPQTRNPSSAPAVPQMPMPPAGIGPTNLPGVPAPPAMPAMPQAPAGLPPGIGPQAQSAGAPAMPALPMMAMMPGEKAELKATGEKTNLLGYACERFELRQRGEVMEIWATDQLFPFQPYQQNQPHRFGPRMIEEQWPELLKAKKLFPLLAVLKFEHGPERYRFEVKVITPEKIEDRDGKLFQPPPDYHEIEPLPF
jgi:hypothetical protein